jgi:glycosyltransferase involved in cell wall biosynthesis
MRKILFISISFPPKKDSESIQTAKYFKYLSKKELAITVLTSSSPTLNMPVDESLRDYTAGLQKLIEIKIFENRYTNYLVNKLFPFFSQMPDSKFSFSWQWKTAVDKIGEKPDIIYSRSYPISSAVMGLKLKKHFNVPWILHLSDPWSEYPLVNFSDFTKRYNEKMEKESFKLADKICFTSTKSIDVYFEKYPQFRDKYEYFPNVYDDEHVVENKHSFKNKLRFVYTGGMIGNRSPIYLLKVLNKVNERQPSLLEKVEFLFAGEADRRNRQCFDDYTHLRCVKYLGPLSMKDAIELQKSADILLVIDNPLRNEREAVFFPSKVLDYLIAQRKIFAITDRFSMTAAIISNTLGACFEHSDEAGIEDFIRSCISAYERHDGTFFFNVEIESTFSASFQAERLSKMFEALSGKS